MSRKSKYTRHIDQRSSIRNLIRSRLPKQGGTASFVGSNILDGTHNSWHAGFLQFFQ